MAIADKLTKLSTDISNAYDEIENKGGTIPANKNTDNLASAIGSISTGTTPTGTKQVSITQNGTTTEDVTDYASAEITTNVPMSAPKVEGTFTLASDGGMPTITHNLGTEKIAVLIYPYSSVTAHAGYRDYSMVYINTIAFAGGDTWTIDLTPYNSTRFPNPVEIEIGSRTDYPRTAYGQSSPWTSQSSITAGTFYGEVPSSHLVTTTTYRQNQSWASGTYKYHIWALN